MFTIAKTNIYLVCTLLLFILCSNAAADLYQWQDEKGNIHVVDDMLLVPPQYKDKVKTLKTKPKPSQETPPAEQSIQPPISPEPPSLEKKLYGDHPLEWWINEFAARKNEISELEKTIKNEKEFIEGYERGRRLYPYRLYSKEDVERYESYKNDLLENENQLRKLLAELEELRRKAQAYDVPREVRE